MRHAQAPWLADDLVRSRHELGRHATWKAQRDGLRTSLDVPALGDTDLLRCAEALLDHHDLLKERDDRGIALLPHRNRTLDPSVERYALDLDGFGGDRLVDHRLVLAHHRPGAHALGQRLALEENSLLLDDRDDPAIGRGNGIRYRLECFGMTFPFWTAKGRPGFQRWEDGRDIEVIPLRTKAR